MVCVGVLEPVDGLGLTPESSPLSRGLIFHKIPGVQEQWRCSGLSKSSFAFERPRGLGVRRPATHDIWIGVFLLCPMAHAIVAKALNSPFEESLGLMPSGRPIERSRTRGARRPVMWSELRQHRKTARNSSRHLLPSPQRNLRGLWLKRS